MRRRLFAGLTFRALVRETFQSTLSDDLTGRSAQLAYFFFFAIFPGFLFFTAVLGMLSAPGTALRASLMQHLPELVPPQAWVILQQAFTQTTQHSGGGKLTFGMIAALWSATAGMSAACDTLNAVHDVKETRPYWKVQVTALSLTLVTGILLLLGLVILMSGDTLLRLTIHSTLHWPVLVLAKTAQWALVLGCVAGGFAFTYYWAPDVKKREWHWITPGAAFGIFLWIASTLALRFYLHFYNSYSATYGTIGAVIILLLWFYVSGFSMLLGAELNATIETAAAKQGEGGAIAKGRKRPGAA